MAFICFFHLVRTLKDEDLDLIDRDKYKDIRINLDLELK